MNKAESLIEKQIAVEYQNALTYKVFALFLVCQGFDNLAEHMRRQSADELKHAEKLSEYLAKRRICPQIAALDAVVPPTSPLEVFERAADLEDSTTQKILGIADAASEINDHSAYQFIQWFVAEQVEEQDTTQRWLQRANMAQTSGNWLVFDHAEEID